MKKKEIEKIKTQIKWNSEHSHMRFVIHIKSDTAMSDVFKQVTALYGWINIAML